MKAYLLISLFVLYSCGRVRFDEIEIKAPKEPIKHEVIHRFEFNTSVEVIVRYCKEQLGFLDKIQIDKCTKEIIEEQMFELEETYRKLNNEGVCCE